MTSMDQSIGICVAVFVVVASIAFFMLKKKAVPFLDKFRVQVPLKEVTNLSPDTLLLRFGLPTPTTVLGLPVGKHFKVFCPNPKGKVPGQWNGREDSEADETEIMRAYTPTSSDDDLGHVDLVIKVYKSGVVDRFPDGGKMSQYFAGLKVGDLLDIQGPFGMIEYKGKGLFTYGRKELQKKHVGMMAGGTGITPMLQVLVAILKDKSDTTKCSMIFANKNESDILVRDTLEELQKKHPDRFKLHYTLDEPPADWKYSKGFINEEMIKEHIPPAGPDTVVLMCGPPPMVTFACKANLTKLGHGKADMLAF